MPFNASCPAFIHALPIKAFIYFFEKHDKSSNFVKKEWLACGIKRMHELTAAGRTPISSNTQLLFQPELGWKKENQGTYVFDYLTDHQDIRDLFILNRPDLAAYLFQNTLNVRNNILHALELAKLYQDGTGISQDKEKAKHLYRTIVFPIHIASSPEHCKKFISRNIETLNDMSFYDHILDNNDLFQNQISWALDLCVAEPEDISQKADLYSKDISPIIAYTLYEYAYRITNKTKFSQLAYEQKEKLWPGSLR